jgi:hypothetical protein
MSGLIDKKRVRFIRNDLVLNKYRKDVIPIKRLLIFTLLFLTACGTAPSSDSEISQIEAQSNEDKQDYFYNKPPFSFKNTTLYKDGKEVAWLLYDDKSPSQAMRLFVVDDDVIDASLNWLSQHLQVASHMKNTIKKAHKNDQSIDFIAHGFDYSIVPNVFGGAVEIVFGKVDSDNIERDKPIKKNPI